MLQFSCSCITSRLLNNNYPAPDLDSICHDALKEKLKWAYCCCADEPWALERLEAVLKPIMWRNDKISVGDELKLPPRTLDVSMLRSHMLLPSLTFLALQLWSIKVVDACPSFGYG